jgi:hypothetical protein
MAKWRRMSEGQKAQARLVREAERAQARRAERGMAETQSSGRRVLVVVAAVVAAGLAAGGITLVAAFR